ncbi:hypothetical protein AB6A40_003377 [Gnathostoma spinigerum]|uniref:ornithine decarboxylase n=1 Tax=Gnathostoma spinigerum TaxID=75299 RepID=A0ABD6E9J0_9BILA
MQTITMALPHRLELIGNKKISVFSENVGHLKVAQAIALHKSTRNVEDAFFTVDIGKVIQLFMKWNQLLPRIQPFYAVKCNNDEVLLKVLANLGCGFDVASKNEIDKVIKVCSVSAERLIYANPCKTSSYITYARRRGVSKMTFDNEEELEKIAKLHSTAELVLRIAVSDENAQCPLSIKFGCDPVTEGPNLLMAAAKLGMAVIGISFHVGSGCNDAETFRLAICHARGLFDMGETLGHKMTLLDIGGGYPGSEKASLSFENIVNVIAPCCDEYFPPETNVKIIAEPGRYFACSPFSLTVNLIASTKVKADRITKDGRDGHGFMYYINDGVYGSFSCILADHTEPTGYPLHDKEGELYPSIVWGPTCDGLDKIEDCRFLPHLSVGDWMHYPDMGAYTMASASNFNGFEKPKAYYFVEEKYWQMLYDYDNV